MVDDRGMPQLLHRLHGLPRSLLSLRLVLGLNRLSSVGLRRLWQLPVETDVVILGQPTRKRPWLIPHGPSKRLRLYPVHG